MKNWIQLLRWNKPSGRLILLIPAGWSLWLIPSPPPNPSLVILMILGGLCVSGAGCIANDLWDREIDKQVARTNQRPLAKGSIRISTAFGLLALMLVLSLIVVLLIPSPNRELCLILALLSLPPILIYPSAKRWFPYPQALLAICWGFAVLIPWSASEATLIGGLPLIGCWSATIMWTFGFDTVYAMADAHDDKKLGLNSSVLSLGNKSKFVVATSYAATSFLLGMAAFNAGVSHVFWLIWIIASIGMQHEVSILNKTSPVSKAFSKHFQNQVLLGGLLLLGLMAGRVH